MNTKTGEHWCMATPIKVDINTVGKLSSSKAYRCPLCKRRVNLKQYDYAPYGSVVEPIWHWPAHKIRKTKR